jgi:LPPG:FO 2-phospho-L-lactate transferase
VDKKVLALCGGVGGAKLALGLTRVLSPHQLTIVVNTGDDFEHFGLPICPDLDTVTYTLAGVSNRELGWGRENDSWNCLDTLEQLGAETWFRLGDRDLAIHLARRAMTDGGDSLSDATSKICRKLGVDHPVSPMTDEAVRTRVYTDTGELSFQHYFVREQCQPVVRGFHFAGADEALPAPAFSRALEDAATAAIIICPSNPFVSIDPLLALAGIRARLKACAAPVLAVSPVIGISAIKGPTTKMMTELGMDLSSVGVFRHYGDLLDGFVIDTTDRSLVPEFPDPGRIHCCNTLMNSLEERVELAKECLNFALQWSPPKAYT